MGFLTGKRALIVGVANNFSIAYGIAQAFHREGAELAFTYQNDRLKDRVVKIAADLNSEITMPCDVSSDSEIEKVFTNLKKYWDSLDIIVHSVAYAPREQLENEDYVECVTREGFKIAHDISAYSFVALAKAGREMLRQNGALLTVTFQGSMRVIPNYNVMGVAKASLEANVRYMASALGEKGIRVNAVSPGAIRTLAASGIKHLRKLLEINEKLSMLHRNVNIEEVGNTAAFLCSDLASGITGEIVHVDGGLHCAVGRLDLLES